MKFKKQTNRKTSHLIYNTSWEIKFSSKVSVLYLSQLSTTTWSCHNNAAQTLLITTRGFLNVTNNVKAALAATFLYDLSDGCVTKHCVPSSVTESFTQAPACEVTCLQHREAVLQSRFSFITTSHSRAATNQEGDMLYWVSVSKNLFISSHFWA